MISIMGLLRCSKGATLAPRMMAAPPDALRGHILNRVVDRAQRAIEYDRSSLEVDAFSQMFFDDVSSTTLASAGGAIDLAAGIDAAAIQEVTVVTTLQNTVIAPPRSGALKRMSLLRKRPDISSEMFQDEWFNMHAVLVRRLPGVLGYRQNLVVDGPLENQTKAVDGIVELWFGDYAAIDAAFTSARGLTTMTHAKEFIAQINTYVVEPQVIVAER